MFIIVSVVSHPLWAAIFLISFWLPKTKPNVGDLEELFIPKKPVFGKKPGKKVPLDSVYAIEIFFKEKIGLAMYFKTLFSVFFHWVDCLESAFEAFALFAHFKMNHHNSRFPLMSPPTWLLSLGIQKWRFTE